MGRIYDATWGRMFSALYDRAFEASEEAGLREMRRELLCEARGRVLELGAGTGLNLELYPREGLDSLTVTEPDPHMFKQLRQRTEKDCPGADLVEAGAEDLPFADDSFDTVVVTLVLCTVPNQPAALKEISRVLAPGGELLFLEHVRANHPDLARWQDRLEKPWRFLGDGCHCNRDTVSAISAAGFQLGDVERDELPKAPPIVKPLVKGSARAVS
ncbi:MAG TPA: class I SAM-dependent methyltransferase [Solirubrobacterales bacterium]|jgi:ubiquinone/menaquinone biosynthesis C-methylase UbiE|nr:class I SAM-dependent methyltransferase [Solirubrobacterales bacterium]